jgi:outer membrane receptor protein involved in Fe transport
MLLRKFPRIIVLCALAQVSDLVAQIAPAPASTPAPVPAPVRPASKEDPVQLSVFEVTTSQDIGYQSTNAAEVTRMNTPIENIPMNVTVFNQQFIEDILATDTSQVLAYDASAMKTSENDGFMARGSASVGTNFLDGFAQSGGFGSQPLANIDRVEVLRGPAAILYGSGGYGGTFNRITKQPRPAAAVALRSILSDARSFRTELDWNAGKLPALGERLLFRVNGILDRGQTWFGQRRREHGVAPTFAWNLGPRTKAIVGYLYNWRETQASWETPVHLGNPKGLVTGDGVFRVMPRKTNWTVPEDFRRNTRQVTSLDFRHAFTPDLQFRAQAQYETRDQLQQETIANGNTLTILRDTALTGRGWREIPRITRGYRTRDEIVWNVRTGPFAHRLLAGFGVQQQYDRNITYASALSGNNNFYPNVTYAQFLANPALGGHTNPLLLLPVNLFDRGVEPPVPAIPQRPPAPLTADTQTYTASQDYYVNDVFSFAEERFFVMAGARRTEFRRKTINWFAGGGLRRTSAPTVYSLAEATSGSVGAVWHLNAAKTFSLYGNLNNSFDPEFRSNPDGTKLDPEVGEQQEVGLRFSLLSGRVQGLVTAFDLLQDNVTRADPDRVGFFLQENGQRSTGVEFSLNGRVTDQWLVMGGYANTDARNERTGVAKDLQPKHRFTAFNRYNFTTGALKGFSASLGTIYTGERPLTRSTMRNSPDWGPLPPWWRVDAIIGYKYRVKGSRYAWDFSAKATNVFDNTDIYYVAANHRYTLDPGREWQVVAGLKF